MTNLDKTMEQNEEEIIDSENDTETTDNADNQDSENDTEVENEDVDALKKKIATLEAQKDHWRNKAQEKPAQSDAKTATVKPKSGEKEANLSTKDTYALMQANVHLDDIDEVVKYAKFEGITVAEALNNNVVKTILKDKSEMRNTAEATNTGSARRTSGKVSEDALLDRASKGEMPESDEDIARLVAARRNRK